MEDRQIGELDQILDCALTAYAPMPPGLEGRVLEHVARLESKRRGTRVYTLSTLVVATLLLGLFVRHRPALQSPRVYVTSVKVRTEQRPQSQSLFHKVARQKRFKRTHQRVKASVFPSPTPMTIEERALVKFVQKSPEAAAAVFADLEKPEQTVTAH